MTLQEFLTQTGIQESDITNLAGQEALDAVQADGFALKYVKPDDQTTAIIDAAIAENPQALRFVASQSEAICLDAVNANGLALEYVRTQTQAVAVAAVEQNSHAAIFVDKHIFDPA